MNQITAEDLSKLQSWAFRLGVTVEEMTRIAEATSWEAVMRAVARRGLRVGDAVLDSRHISFRVVALRSGFSEVVVEPLKHEGAPRVKLASELTLVAGAPD